MIPVKIHPFLSDYVTRVTVRTEANTFFLRVDFISRQAKETRSLVAVGDI